MDLDVLKAELVRDEGLRLKAYRDTVGKLTIGVGHNLDDVGISYAAAMQMLEDDILDVMGQMNSKLEWWATLDDARQRALANMAFNLGINGLLGFHHMLAAAKAGDFEEAANQMLSSKWAQQVGARAVRLAQMMRTGLS